MTAAAKRVDLQKIVGYVLVAAMVIGLIYIVHWVIADASRPRYPGIEKMRGELPPERRKAWDQALRSLVTAGLFARDPLGYGLTTMGCSQVQQLSDQA